MSKSFEETGAGAEGFGKRLRREREMRGISLDEIAASTKIGTRLLRALEDEQFDLLPGGIFNKSYVRAYARHVGLDEEQAVADYLKATRETPPDVRLIAHQNSSMHGDPNRYGSTSRRDFPWIPAFVLLVVIVGGAGGWRLYQQRQRERLLPARTHDLATSQLGSAAQTPGSDSSGNAALGRAGSVSPVSPSEAASVPQLPANSTGSASAAVRTVEAAESSPRPSGSDAVAGTSASKVVAGSEGDAPFEVTVRAKDRARVEVRSDGDIVVRGVIEPSEVRTFHATKRLVFWTANAGEVELSFNGKNVSLNSGENDEQVLVFDSHGLLVRPAAQ